MKKILGLSLLSLALVACGSQEEATDTQTETTNVATVKTMKLQPQTIEVLQEYTAAINAYDKVYLAPTVPGRIVDVKVEVNDRVSKNQTLVLMDDAQLNQLKVQYETLKKEMLRMDTLIIYGSVSQQAYDQLKAQLEATETSYNNLKENTFVTSPFNGIVTNRYFDDNEIFSGAPNTQEGKAAILTIEQIDRLKVNIEMSARFFPYVKNGMAATLTTDIYPDKEFDGKVSLIYPTINSQTRTFTVEIMIPNSSKILRPGMYAKVKVKLGEKDAIVVPSSVVLMQDGTSNRYIYISENGVAKRVMVEIGERFDDKLEIIAKENLVGKQVIVAGQSKIDSGDALVENN